MKGVENWLRLKGIIFIIVQNAKKLWKKRDTKSITQQGIRILQPQFKNPRPP